MPESASNRAPFDAAHDDQKKIMDDGKNNKLWQGLSSTVFSGAESKGPMNVSLTCELERLVQARVASGR
jgi:hypothetical protein